MCIYGAPCPLWDPIFSFFDFHSLCFHCGALCPACRCLVLFWGMRAAWRPHTLLIYWTVWEGSPRPSFCDMSCTAHADHAADGPPSIGAGRPRGPMGTAVGKKNCSYIRGQPTAQTQPAISPCPQASPPHPSPNQKCSTTPVRKEHGQAKGATIPAGQQQRRSHPGHDKCGYPPGRPPPPPTPTPWHQSRRGGEGRGESHTQHKKQDSRRGSRHRDTARQGKGGSPPPHAARCRVAGPKKKAEGRKRIRPRWSRTSSAGQHQWGQPPP